MKTQEKKTLTTIDFIKSLCEKTEEYDFSDKTVEAAYRPSDISRVFSFDPELVSIVEKVNSYGLPKAAHYQFLFQSIPKKRRFFQLKEIFQKKQEADKETKLRLLEYFEFGSGDLSVALELLDKSTVESIVELFEGGI